MVNFSRGFTVITLYVQVTQQGHVHKFNIDQYEFERLFGLNKAAKFTLVDLLVSLSLKQTWFLVFFLISERVYSHVGLRYWILALGRHPLLIHTCLIGKIIEFSWLLLSKGHLLPENQNCSILSLSLALSTSLSLIIFLKFIHVINSVQLSSSNIFHFSCSVSLFHRIRF